MNSIFPIYMVKYAPGTSTIASYKYSFPIKRISFTTFNDR